jgi:hypothetical protein
MIALMPAMPAHAHDDDAFKALRGPSSEDARESLVYWRERLDRLPRRKRAARREARAMVLAWEDRVRTAEIERWGGGALGRLAGAIAVLRTVRPRALARHAARLVPRSLVVGVLTVALGSALIAGILIGAILSALL